MVREQTDTATAEVVAEWAGRGDGRTIVGAVAPGSSSSQGETVAAIIMGLAAGRDGNARAFGGTPGGSRGGTLAISTIVEIVGATRRNLDASVGGRAPSVADPETQAFATAVISLAADGDLDAPFLSRTPFVPRS